MRTVLAAREAMATRFEIVACGSDAPKLRAVMEDALDEVDRLESRLSCFRHTSDLHFLNTHAECEPVKVEPGLFSFLVRAKQLAEETSGAFDPTIGSLMEFWGFRGDGDFKGPENRPPGSSPQLVGMQWVELNPETRTVRFRQRGLRLDPGAIGKGWAVEAAATVLREAGVTCALIHGGTSSVMALGAPPGRQGWTVAIPAPEVARALEKILISPVPAPGTLLATLELCDVALSVSTVWGRTVRRAGREVSHVMDPRTGQPATGALMAAVVTGSPTDGDALSTALIVGGGRLQEELHLTRPGWGSLLVTQDADGNGWGVTAMGFGVDVPGGCRQRLEWAHPFEACQQRSFRV